MAPWEAEARSRSLASRATAVAVDGDAASDAAPAGEASWGAASCDQDPGLWLRTESARANELEVGRTRRVVSRPQTGGSRRVVAGEAHRTRKGDCDGQKADDGVAAALQPARSGKEVARR